MSEQLTLTKCEDTHGQRVRCIACARTRYLKNTYADANGEPFKAYYCERCKGLNDLGVLVPMTRAGGAK